MSDIEPSGLSFVSAGDAFGSACILIPDVDGNGFPDIFVTAKFDDSPSSAIGTAYLMLLDSGFPTFFAYYSRIDRYLVVGATPFQLTVIKTLVIGTRRSQTANFAEIRSLLVDPSFNTLGTSLAFSDLDRDGFTEVLMGASGCNKCHTLEFGTSFDYAGGIYVLTLNKTADASELIRRELSILPADLAQFGLNIPPGSEFGYSMTFVDDMDFDGKFLTALRECLFKFRK